MTETTTAEILEALEKAPYGGPAHESLLREYTRRTAASKPVFYPETLTEDE